MNRCVTSALFPSLILYVLLLVLDPSIVFAQTGRKTVSAMKLDENLKIDGYLNEAAWQQALPATDFIDFEPYNGRPSAYKTEVKFVYNDKAIYVGAHIFDTSPDSLFKQMGQRDDLGVADFFGVYFDPYNDSKTAYGFFVSCRGVQADFRLMADGGRDYNWDAVWSGKVRITEDGWLAELEIPYSALRFPERGEHIWGVNMLRSVQRRNIRTSWNFINKEKSGELNQAGMLQGIKNIKPSLRLSFIPYFSSYFNKNRNGKWTSNVKGGMDLKYGISENFTLDMALIPDFGQVESDDEQLNLSPFESFYEEKRPFFMEGTELFNKAGIFYSRRIGARRFDVWADSLRRDEIVDSRPLRNKLVNLTKVSGKFKNGLSVGLLNGMTAPSYVTAKDTLTGQKRDIRVQSLTNYNVTVLDQSLGNNSYVSLINTNTNRFDDHYLANTTGTEFNFTNASNTYSLRGNGAISQIWKTPVDDESGFRYRLWLGKVSGKFRYDVARWVESDTYNPNDLGFNPRNNDVGTEAFLHYNIYEPKGHLRNLNSDFSITYSQLYEPRRFVNMVMRFWLTLTFINNSRVSFHMGGRPQDMVDYFEPRVAGRKFKRPRDIFISLGYDSNWTKKFSYELTGNFSRQDDHGHRMLSLSFHPTCRISDRFRVQLFSYAQDLNHDLGFVAYHANKDEIYFGGRDIVTVENQLNMRLGITNKLSFNSRVRHYWSNVKYTDFYRLEENGHLSQPVDYMENHDVTFNAFNADMGLSWNFAPGSELTLYYQSLQQEANQQAKPNYFENLKQIFSANQNSSISLRVLYYIDFKKLKF